MINTWRVYSCIHTSFSLIKFLPYVGLRLVRAVSATLAHYRGLDFPEKYSRFGKFQRVVCGTNFRTCMQFCCR